MEETAFRVVKFLFIASVIGVFGSVILGDALPLSAQQYLGELLAQKCPCTVLPAITTRVTETPLSPYLAVCFVLSLPTAILTAIITGTCFAERERQYAAEQLSDPKAVRRGWSVLLVGIAMLMSASFHTSSLLLRAAVAVVAFIIMRSIMDKMLFRPVEAAKEESEALEFMHTGLLDGVRVDLTIAGVTHMKMGMPGNSRTMYYARAETPHKDLQFVIQNDRGILNLKKLRYSPVQLPIALAGAHAVSNDPTLAEGIIAANASTLRLLLNWGSFVALNLPPNTQSKVLFTRPEEDPDDFCGTGVYMAVRDVPKRDDPQVCQTAMSLLVILSKGSAPK